MLFVEHPVVFYKRRWNSVTIFDAPCQSLHYYCKPSFFTPPHQQSLGGWCFRLLLLET